MAYRVIAHALWGQTLGKRLMRISVVDYTHRGPISVRQSLLRECAWFVAVIVYAVTIVMERLVPRAAGVTEGAAELAGDAYDAADSATAMRSPEGRALHDRFAGTAVVSVVSLDPSSW